MTMKTLANSHKHDTTCRIRLQSSKWGRNWWHPVPQGAWPPLATPQHPRQETLPLRTSGIAA